AAIRTACPFASEHLACARARAAAADQGRKVLPRGDVALVPDTCDERPEHRVDRDAHGACEGRVAVTSCKKGLRVPPFRPMVGLLLTCDERIDDHHGAERHASPSGSLGT